MIVEINRSYKDSATITPEFLQEIERGERELHHEMTTVIQQIRNFNICDEDTEAVCQSLQLGSRLYNEEKFLVAKHYQKGRSELSNFPTAQRCGTTVEIMNPDDFDIPNRKWQELQAQVDNDKWDDELNSSDESDIETQIDQIEQDTDQDDRMRSEQQKGIILRNKIGNKNTRNMYCNGPNIFSIC